MPAAPSGPSPFRTFVSNPTATLPPGSDVPRRAPGTPFTLEAVEALAAARGEPDWVRERRVEAFRVYESLPMPTLRDEAWRFTDLRVLKLGQLRPPQGAETVTPAQQLPDAVAALVRAAGESAVALVQRGAHTGILGDRDALAQRGVLVTTPGEAARTHAELMRKHFQQQVTPETGKFAALHDAFWSGGLVVHVPRGVTVERPIRLFVAADEAGSVAAPHILVVLEREARATVVVEYASETLAAQAAALGATELVLGEASQLEYVSVQEWGRSVVHLATERATVGRDAKLVTLHVGVGARLARTELEVDMNGSGGRADLLGIYLGGRDQHIDFHTLQNHYAPHASSDLLFKGALTENGRSVYAGKIIVEREAQGTDAYQANRNLLLSDDARADSIPGLEIEADEVRCTHGATVAQTDPEQVFYLESRGLTRDAAERLIVFGFFDDVLDRLPVVSGVHEHVRQLVRHKVLAAEATTTGAAA